MQSSLQLSISVIRSIMTFWYAWNLLHSHYICHVMIIKVLCQS